MAFSRPNSTPNHSQSFDNSIDTLFSQEISNISQTSVVASATHVRAGRPKQVPMSKAMREIKRYQDSVDFLIPRQAIRRLCREIFLDFRRDIRCKPEAFEAMQAASEDYIVELMKYANTCAIHAKRITIMPKDLKLAYELLHVHRRPFEVPPFYA